LSGSSLLLHGPQQSSKFSTHRYVYIRTALSFFLLGFY